ncbi:hypothetical protein OUZ56_001389 [Daphnia magna]|uniref:Uncharacterized protein n=1 Tax=Daphnia magna TaxID=35525 RepID=A0ABR0A2K0_9CRUS|nr:hypothetical protein OUZ56_001389 [Daphnia magna]
MRKETLYNVTTPHIRLREQQSREIVDDNKNNTETDTRREKDHRDASLPESVKHSTRSKRTQNQREDQSLFKLRRRNVSNIIETALQWMLAEIRREEGSKCTRRAAKRTGKQAVNVTLPYVFSK